MVKDDRSLLGLPLDGFSGGVGERKDRLLTQWTISQLAISYRRGKVTQIVMKLATSPSEMSGSTLGSRLLDSPVMVMVSYIMYERPVS